MVSSDQYLELTLPGRDHFVKGFCGRSKIIGRIKSLFMEINMYLWKPFIINL
jgi:hypothetical protein